MQKLLQKPSAGRWHALARQLKKISSATALGSTLLFGSSLYSSQANAQSIANNYVFSASSGTYTPLGATATQLSGMLTDTHLSGALPIGFTFNFDGVNYTEVKASSNGFLSFKVSGTDSQTGNNLATVSTSSRPIVAPLWDDLDGRATVASVGVSKASYETTGAVGSRVFTFEWDKWEFNYSSSNPVISFQVKLYEGTNKIEFIYQQESGAVTSGSASIGIAGTGTGPGNFISLNNTTASPTASYATETTGINTKPATGQIYTFNQVATPANDISVTALTGLATEGCFGPNQTITFTIKNIGTSALDMSVTPVTVSAAVTGTNPTTFTPVVVNTGTLAPGATQNVTVSTSYNMSTAGTYTFNASATTQGEVITANDALLAPAIRTVSATAAATPVAFPQTVDFTGFTGSNLTTVFPNWKESTGSTAPTGTTSAWTNGSTGNVTAKVNLAAASKREWLVGPKITPTATTTLLFKAAVTTTGALTPHANGMAGTDDKVQAMVSTDCGVTYTPIYTIDGTTGLTNVLTNQYVSLAAYAGQNIVVAFFATEGSVDDAPDYDFHIDDVFIGTPTAAINLGATAFVSPLTTGCYSATENATVTIRNFGSAPIDFSTTNATVSVRTHGAGSGTISTTVNTGILAPGATQNVSVGTLNMTSAGTYNLRAYTTVSGDTDASSDTTRTTRSVAPIANLPLPVTFNGFTGSNLTTVFPNWREATGRTLPTGTTSAWTSSATAQTTFFGSTTAKLNFPTSTSTTREEWIVGPNIIATATTAMAFKAAVTSSAGTAAATMLPTDSIKVMVSTNCGASFTKVGAISGSNNLSTTLTDFVFNLGSYAGQNIIVALLGTNGSARPTSSYDLILDDIFLGTPPPLDMGVSALVSPVLTSACLTAAEPLIVTIKNYHAQPINFAVDSTIVTVNVTGALTQTFTAKVKTGTLASGATQNITLGTVNLSAPGTYTFNSFTTLNGDGNASNNAIAPVSIVNGTIATFPFLENFESFTPATNATGFTNGWITTPGNTTSAYRWNVSEGKTPSSSTGPTVDHTTGTTTGNFIFTEASNGASGDSTILVSPCINLTGQTNIGMEFWYHMYGSTMGNLYVDIFNGTNWIRGAFTISGQQQTATTEAWRKAKIDLSAYSGSVIKVRFRATRGTDFYGDLAIDDVLFYKRSTIDISAVAMTTPGTIGCFSAAEPVTITLLNDGFAPIDFTVNPATITVNVTGAGTQTLTTTVNTGTLAIGATQNVTVGSANMTAFGTYTFNASATATGDINTANAAMTSATRTLTAPVSLPQAVNFTGFTGTNLTTGFPNWYEASGATAPAGISSSWTSKTGLGGTSNITAKINLFSNTANEWIIGPKITATTATALKFKAAVTDYDALTPDATGMTGTDDKVQVMVSTDCGITFTPVYTMDATSNLTNVLTSQTVSLATYAGQNIIVAFFATEGTINDTPDYDFHIDDINLLNLPPTDLELVSLTLPSNTCGMTATETICVTIRNSGSTAASNFPVSYVINAGTPVTETVTATIAPFTTAQYCFTTKANFLAVGTYSVTATVNATGDADANNNSVTGTATTTPMIATYPYSEGFENGAGGWTAAGTNSTWALGTPAGTVINSAAAGIKSWVTNLTGNYVDNEKSAVTGPCFNFSSLTNPVISMKIWWDTEFSWDGAVLQSSIDGGTTWQNVGAMNDPNNWYNDNTIGGNPGGQQIGWTGTGTTGSGGWVTASHALTGLGGQSLVRLRIAFASDGSTVKEGFAFDEINISDMVVVPTITAGGPTTFCTGGSVVLTAATTTPGATYTWALNGTAIPGATSATYTATTSGNYTVTAALTGFVSSTSAATVVTVNAIPAVPTVTAGGATTFCQGGTVALTAASTTTGVTYQWFLNGTAITGATAATYSATTAGSYTVEATNNGCSSAASTATAVTVNPAPAVPTITAGGPTTFCSGDSVVLTGASTTTGVTYQWLLNGTTINGATAATHAALTAGNYAIVAINAAGCSDTSTVTAVTVNPTPAKPTITQSGGSGQTLTSSATTGNQWFLNGQPISGATAQIYQTTANGNYAVVVTNTNGCSSDTSAVVNITNTGIKGDFAGMSVSVYPNPSNGKFNVKLTGYKQDAAIELYSLTGQLIVKETAKAGREVTPMQVENLAAGTYLLKVVSEKGVQVSKLIVE